MEQGLVGLVGLGFCWVLFVGWLWLFMFILPVYLRVPYAFSNKNFLTSQKNRQTDTNVYACTIGHITPGKENYYHLYLESVKYNQTFNFIATYCITIHHGMIYINRCVNARFFHLPHQCLSSIHMASLAEKFIAKDKKHHGIGNKEFLKACILCTYIILKKNCKSECCANCQWVLAQNSTSSS